MDIEEEELKTRGLVIIRNNWIFLQTKYEYGRNRLSFIDSIEYQE